MENQELMQKLEHMLLELQKPVVPFEQQIWDATTAADYFGISPNYFTYTVAVAPGFPGPIEIPGTRKRRWRAIDLFEWATRNRAKPRKGAV